jgi:uncharacterized protein (DUF885 family)
MSGFSPYACCGFALLALSSCGAPPAPGSAAAPSRPPLSSEQLSRIVERYWDERLVTENAISPQYLADSLSIEQRFLTEALSVPRDPLDAQMRLTYDIFKRQRELAIEAMTFPSELLPINPFSALPLQAAAMAGELSQHPSAGPQGYENWLNRIDEYSGWTQQAIANMRAGVRRGYTSPRILIERMIPILDQLSVEGPGNVFYAPQASMPAAIKEPDRSRLIKLLNDAVSQKVLPANRALRDFLKQEYLPATRSSLALAALPLGNRWYAYRVRRATGTLLSADEIARIGAAEVERLGHAPASSDAAAVATVDLVAAYTDLEARVRTAMPSLFAQIPQADFDIRETQWLPDPLSALYYRRVSFSGTPPAVLYVNIGRSGSRTVSVAGFLQEGLPGRHLQAAIQQERADLPRFRRFGSDAAFNAGWGLYAASQGDALGLYPDESTKRIAGELEMQCAVALVVDTGLQAKNWTRAQALDYLHAHLSLDEVDAQALIEWYAANPGDALACMMGELKFRALRTRAQQVLASRFDVREFHTEILRDGAMPLDILEAKMKLWMDAAK